MEEKHGEKTQPHLDVKNIPERPGRDPFYEEPNIAHLRRGVAALNAGKGKPHELLLDDDE